MHKFVSACFLFFDLSVKRSRPDEIAGADSAGSFVPRRPCVAVGSRGPRSRKSPSTFTWRRFVESGVSLFFSLRPFSSLLVSRDFAARFHGFAATVRYSLLFFFCSLSFSLASPRADFGGTRFFASNLHPVRFDVNVQVITANRVATAGRARDG